MRRFLFVPILFAVTSLWGSAYDGGKMPNSLVTDDIYVSSWICSNRNGIYISTFPAYFDHINVSSAGTAGSWFELFDAQLSTPSSSLMSPPYVADSVADWFFDRTLSSGLIVNIYGGTTCMDFILKRR